jgi:hypothetical protein
LILAALVVFLGDVCISDPGGFSASRVALGFTICALSWLPAILYLRRPDRPPVPLLPLTGLFYFAACGLPAFYDFSASPVQDVWHIDPSTEALETVVYALLGLYAGYYFSSKTRLFRHIHPISLPRVFPFRRLTTFLWTLLTVHLVGLVFREQIMEVHLDQMLVPLGYFPFGMFLILWYRRILGPVQKLALVGCAVMEATTRFATGSIASLYLFLLFLLIVVWIERQKIPVLLVAAGLVLFALFNVAKTEYRALTWGSGPSADESIAHKAILFGEITIRPFTTAGSDTSYPAVDALLSRLSVLAFLTHVVNLTPEVVPYWRGETYATLAYKLIPRMLWKDKPIEVLGYEFSRRYGLRFTDESTTFNVPWVVEMFANFGNLGVVLGMTLVGLLFAWMERKLNTRSMTTLELMVGATILFDLFYQESNFSLMAGSKILFALLLYWMIRAVLSDHRSHAPAGWSLQPRPPLQSPV